jgi:hypothetical protein
MVERLEPRFDFSVTDSRMEVSAGTDLQLWRVKENGW